MSNFVRVASYSVDGVDFTHVDVEVHLANGMPRLNIVGLPQRAVAESKERVRSAIINSGFRFPQKRITVSLVPADIPKYGTGLDLAVAVAILQASKQLAAQRTKWHYWGSLSLNGAVQTGAEALAVVLHAKSEEHNLILGTSEHLVSTEQALVAPQRCLYLRHLRDTRDITRSTSATPEHVANTAIRKRTPAKPFITRKIYHQSSAVEAVCISSVGRHNLLLTGAPGTGKTLLANTAFDLLPELSSPQLIEVKRLYSCFGKSYNSYRPPMRAPHHSTSVAGLISSVQGRQIVAGDAVMCHQGVLLLDEVTEFSKQALTALREPLQNHSIHISRARRNAVLPANFQLIATCNLCPCGWLGHSIHKCKCGDQSIAQYRRKLSGPLLDRFAVGLVLHNAKPLSSSLATGVSVHQMANQTADEIADDYASVDVIDQALFERIDRARRRTKAEALCNAELTDEEIAEHCQLSEPCEKLLAQSVTALGLSYRSQINTLKLARSVADWHESDDIDESHLKTALLLQPSRILAQR